MIWNKDIIRIEKAANKVNIFKHNNNNNKRQEISHEASNTDD